MLELSTVQIIGGVLLIGIFAYRQVVISNHVKDIRLRIMNLEDHLADIKSKLSD